MLQLWHVLVLISVLALSCYLILQKVLLSKETNAFGLSVIFQFVGAGLIGLVAVIHGFSWPPVNLIGLVLVSSVLYALGTVFIFKAYQQAEASEVTIIASLRSIVTIISAVL